MVKNKQQLILIGAAIVVAALLVIAFTPLGESLTFHLNQWKYRIDYALNPPEEVVFVPRTTNPAVRVETFTPTALPAETQNAATPTVGQSPTPAVTPTPPPAQANITGIRYIDQHYGQNKCAPATLAMALSYWGWDENPSVMDPFLMPFEFDKNVMPYELVSFVAEQTQQSVISRTGGTIELLERLISAGFPVMVEKGVYERDLSGKVSWMGHYQVVSGYDRAQQRFTTQDSYHTANYIVSYEDMQRGWRSFNYTFLVIYNPEKEADLFQVLGSYADVNAANQASMQIAQTESASLEGQAKFFALFNYGSSLVSLQDYYGASQAYDQAWAYYAGLPAEDRPWRIMWYQTGPYFAYYYSGRYQDLIDLATQTIDAASQPYLEESWYWRARGYAAAGMVEEAVSDLRTSLQYHPEFSPSVAMLQELGYTAEP